jgi:AraC-like DNA-binding protein
MIEEFPKLYLYRRLVQAKIHIDQQYVNNINLKAIADEAFFSKFHFIRLFKTIYGKTPHQYLINLRIEKAKLLLQTEVSIAYVCFSVGFESVSSFTGLFKRITSITPSTYKYQQLKRKQEIYKQPLKYIPNCFAEQYGWSKDRNFREVSI